MGEWKTVSKNRVKNVVTAIPHIQYWPHELVKEEDRGASWESTIDNRPTVMEMARKRPLAIRTAWRQLLIV